MVDGPPRGSKPVSQGASANSSSQRPYVNQQAGQSKSKAAQNTDSHNAPSRLLAPGDDARPIRDRFNVDTRTGGISFRCPITTSPGRGGFGPFLELVYNSGSAAKNGVFGAGWQLTGVESITRKTTVVIPTYDDDHDIFVHSSFGDLVPVTHGAQGLLERQEEVGDRKYRVRHYRARVELDLVRVERWLSVDGEHSDVHWRTISSKNITTIFGSDSNSQLIHSHANSGKKACFSWLANEAYDSHGNQMVFSYKPENAALVKTSIAGRVNEACRNLENLETQRYLKSIRYGNKTPNRDLRTWKPIQLQDNANQWMFEVVFDYGEHTAEPPTTQENGQWMMRLDPFSVYTSGFEIRTYRQCRRVLMFHHFPNELKDLDCLVAATEFEYKNDPKSGVSMLRSCTPCHYSPVKDSDHYASLRLGCSTFQYWAAPDPEQMAIEELELEVAGLSAGETQWADLDGKGAPGVLSTGSGEGWYFRPNDSGDEPAMDKPVLLSNIPSTVVSGYWSFVDLTGNGRLEVVSESPDGQLRGFYERDEGDWVNFVPFESYPTFQINNSEFRQIDLSGNGLGDILHMVAQDRDELIWYPSLGRRGYGQAKWTTGAPGIPSGEERAVILCDMTGDGLTDIVFISSSSICYWPNTGHGSFGQKVIMNNPPFLGNAAEFSPLRIRMSDITGTGTADLIYLPAGGGINIYYNQSGNGWSDVYTLPNFPALDRFCALDIFDIAGRGTQSLCWTSDYRSPGSTTVRFLDLMGGCKPGLLTECSNGIGGVVLVKYRSSTRYQRDDERAGIHWITQAPFPIHCVESVTTNDLVAQTALNIRYGYRNGYYDANERQFRGFQMVEEWEAEDYATAADFDFSRPPLLRRNWFYIGLESVDSVNILPGSYQSQVMLPSSASIESRVRGERMSLGEVEDAYRALAGQRRRQELFRLDRSAKHSVPYTAAQQTYNVVMQQSAHQDQHGIFRVNAREDFTIHSEADNATDPKIQHSLVLKTDEYGNVCKQAVIHYGKSSSSLEKTEDRQAQEDTIITYTETDYTNAVDSLIAPNALYPGYFLPPLQSETRKYRILSGKEWERGVQDRYIWSDMAAVLLPEHEISIHEESPVSEKVSENGSRVLISKTCTLYSKSDLDGPLPLGKVEPFSTEFQSYQLVFTTELLAKTLRNGEAPLLRPGEIAEALKLGGYLKLDGAKDEWWAPSKRKLFTSRSGDFSNDLDTARSLFYIPNAELDPYGNISYQQNDQYGILPVKIVDAVGNTTLFQNDYVHLQPALITDPNGNRNESAFDPCGRVVGVAQMGKEDETAGDSLDAFVSTLTAEQLKAFVDNPSGPISHELIAKAGKRRIYHDHYDTSQTPIIPSFRAELIRQNHFSDSSASELMINITFLNGSSQPTQGVSLSGNSEENRKWQVNYAIHDSKGETVREFQPFTAPTPHFQFQAASQSVPATTTIRDPLNRTIGVLHADHTWSKTRFSPWSQAIFDTGDTIGIANPADDGDIGSFFEHVNQSWYLPTWRETRIGGSDKAKLAAEKSLVYNDTPKAVHLDALGREIVALLDNGVMSDGQRDIRRHRTAYDERGNARIVRDPLDRIVTQSWHDLLGRPLHSINMDSGHRWLLPDCDGEPLISWSSNGSCTRMIYDGLRRKKSIKLTPSANDRTEVTIVEYVYGDEATGADAEVYLKNNLRGQLYQCRDQSGAQTNNAFDFQGNRLSYSIEYTTEYRTLIDWSEEVSLRQGIHTTTTFYDALNRPLSSQVNDGSRIASVTRAYDAGNRLKSLKSMDSDGASVTSSIENITYSDDNLVTLILYGNGSQTRNIYETDSRRLATTMTKRDIKPTCVQNVSYVYDCVGKIIQKTDDSQNIFPVSGSCVPRTQDFSYDALGQLSEATGREQVDPSDKHLRPYGAYSAVNNTRGTELQMIRYSEKYQYDAVGNIIQVQHAPLTNGLTGWTRVYTYEEPSCTEAHNFSNRLTKTLVGGKTDNYTYGGSESHEEAESDERASTMSNGYNGNGCINSMPGYAFMDWDYNDRLRCFSAQRVTQKDATPEKTWYIYNAEGHRVRKVTDSGTSDRGRSTPTKIKETLYLPQRDIFITYKGDGVIEDRVTITINLGDPNVFTSPVALVEYSSEKQPLVRYQMSDNLELDVNAQVVSWEEYSPYGARTCKAPTSQAPRKYRFAGYQRDSESGLYLCGERYYACWLGRWTSPDPLGTADGLNLYAYVHNDPVNLEDHPGTMGKKRTRTRGPVYTPSQSIPLDKFIVTVPTLSASGNMGLGPRSQVYSAILEFERELQPKEIIRVAERGYRKIMELSGTNPKTARQPGSITALASPDKRTIILASSMRGFGQDRDEPRAYTATQTTSRLRGLFTQDEHTFEHRTGACGEIMALETYFIQNPDAAQLPDGMTAVSYGVEGGVDNATSQTQLAEHLAVMPACSGSGGTWGCSNLLPAANVGSIQGAHEEVALPASRKIDHPGFMSQLANGQIRNPPGVKNRH